MTAKEFEKELKAVDERFTVVENPNRPGLSNIFFDGKNFDLPVISTHNIKDEEDASHRYEFPNGMSARHHSRQEILGRINVFIKEEAEGMYEGIHD